jgi:FAD/FMN-containing dehydrogenase
VRNIQHGAAAPPGTAQPGNGALLVTTKRMRTVTIDPVARVARAEAGTRWQEAIDAAAQYGLAPLSGSSPQVGVVGYTTGGGLSPTMGRAHGWAADRVRAFEIVTAASSPATCCTRTDRGQRPCPRK